MLKEDGYRLADSTVVEPLVADWPAWSYVIAPAVASLHLLHYQVHTMRSYLQNPEAHLDASQDPSLMGGPFINARVESAGEIARLLREAESGRREELEFAREITEFCGRLSAEAKGQSLETFYRSVPERLRGYVELVYDYNNNPLVRFSEGMLYESDYYDEGRQSLSISRLERDGTRPFFMSTPRLRSGGEVTWAVPFADPRVDELFKLDDAPQPLGRLRELLGLSPKDDETLLPLLAREPVAEPERWEGEAVRLRYFGHACVLLEHRGVSVLTDPFVSVLPARGGIERLSYRDLPARIDYALVTHNHCDHFVLETLLRLRHRIGCLVVPRSYGLLYGDVSLKLLARKLGFRQVVELDTFESVPLPEGEIVAVPFLGEHGDLAHGKTAYVVRSGGERVLFGADSNCLDRKVYERVVSHLGPIPTVFLSVEPVGAPLSWSYGALFPRAQRRDLDQLRRQRGCDFRAALAILEAVGAVRVYNYGMGQEPWLGHILALPATDDSPQVRESERLLTETRRRGFVAAERLFGKGEIYLDGKAAPARAHVSGGDDGGGAEPESPPDFGDAEDQFVF
jgi:L-ascorbate metabolism protein UlaG (beta-lactamase superfamily)